MNLRRLLTAVSVLATFTGCTPGMNAAVVSVQQLMKGAPSADDYKLDPQFAYLRVTRGRQVGLMWLGSMEQNRDGPIEVYYSSSGEVLRLQQGRIVGAVGLTTEWRAVEFVDAPRWSIAARSEAPVRYVRLRDVMPGYRAGVRDELAVTPLKAPPAVRLVGIEPRKLVWFEERLLSDRWSRFAGPAASAYESLPPSRYGVALQGDAEVVVYAEQCLAPDLCLTWQRWSQAIQAAAAKAARGDGKD
jgi:hypothetical protein